MTKLTSEKSMWIFNIVAAAFLSVGIFCKLASYLFLFSVIIYEFLIIIKSDFSKFSIFDKMVDLIPIFSTILFWTPISIFLIFPSIQYNNVAFKILSSGMIIGVFGFVISAIILPMRRK